jgi:hypothetical protein
VEDGEGYAIVPLGTEGSASDTCGIALREGGD